MPRYLIHVGPHKTGTTYLQYVFDAARRRLLERGVVYPAEWSASQYEPSHEKLVLNVRAANLGCLSSRFEEIARSGAEYVLISAEDIDHLEISELGSLRRVIHGAPATIIFYCRRWSELLPSLWQERVKHGHDETFPEFFSAAISDPFRFPAMNFSYSLDKYAAIFGKENIKIVSYSNLDDDKHDLAEHFFETFLPQHRSVLDGLLPMANARPNESIPALSVEVIRVLNSYHAAGGGNRDAALRVWFMAHASSFDLTGLYAAIRTNMRTLRFSDASPAVERLHGELFRTYGGLMVEPVRDGRLFDARTNDISFVRPRYLVHSAARAALDTIYAAYLGGIHHQGGTSSAN